MKKKNVNVVIILKHVKKKTKIMKIHRREHEMMISLDVYRIVSLLPDNCY